GTLGALVGGAGGTLSITKAHATHDGYLAQSDWTSFNTKISSSSLSATFPLAYNPSTGAFTYTGLATSSALSASQILYTTGVNTVASAATTSVTCSGLVSCASFYAIGSGSPVITTTATSSNYWYANGTSIYSANSGNVGIGSTSPYAELSIFAGGDYAAHAPATLFAIGSSTAGTATSTLFSVLSNGFHGIGTSTPGTILSIGNTGANYINISNTATSTFAFGLNINNGCYAINGT